MCERGLRVNLHDSPPATVTILYDGEFNTHFLVLHVSLYSSLSARHTSLSDGCGQSREERTKYLYYKDDNHHSVAVDYFMKNIIQFHVDND